MKILLAVDGSPHSLAAAKSLIAQAAAYRDKPEVELVTVHRPVPMLPGMGAAVGKADIQRYYDEEGAKALAAAKKLLDGARIAYQSKILVGDPGDLIAKRANEGGFDLVCLGTPAKWIGSTTYRVMSHAEVPVLVVK